MIARVAMPRLTPDQEQYLREIEEASNRYDRNVVLCGQKTNRPPLQEQIDALEEQVNAMMHWRHTTWWNLFLPWRWRWWRRTRADRSRE